MATGGYTFLVLAVLGSWARSVLGSFVFRLRFVLRLVFRLVLGVRWLWVGWLWVRWLRVSWGRAVFRLFGVGRLRVRLFGVSRLVVGFAGGWDVFGVFGLSFVGDISGESSFGISAVLDNLFATIGKDYVVRSGDNFAITFLLATVIVVFILNSVAEVVWLLWCLLKREEQFNKKLYWLIQE